MSQRVLPQTGFLSDASDQLKSMLNALATEVALKPGEVLFEQGNIGDAFYAVLTGALEISVLSQDGRKLVLALIRPGSLFGEIALFDPGPRTATLSAVEPSTVLRVRNADVLARIRETPDLAVDMITLAGQRMRAMNTQYSEQVFLALQPRLARKILALTADLATPTDPLRLNQSQFADFVGATREAVSKTLSEWKRLGVIEASRAGLIVVDRPALETLACLDRI
ncbi:Crp/Fnr family transcriptional regulator [Chachezhania antarctica]|uniref:Crp/Fnr family transcriptional regulator n=1 Tax=Chachezhania antarctica TaxID=2340860 RepID=UPI000EB5D592|nr:Crp/Fnr family transcriptional regulator [Chachezhania antarctica]|tara:strand:+ start:3396 stop:4070 length:675 start_codon:yes stop_codon:yes gene_type:complete